MSASMLAGAQKKSPVARTGREMGTGRTGTESQVQLSRFPRSPVVVRAFGHRQALHLVPATIAVPDVAGIHLVTLALEDLGGIAIAQTIQVDELMDPLRKGI